MVSPESAADQYYMPVSQVEQTLRTLEQRTIDRQRLFVFPQAAPLAAAPPLRACETGTARPHLDSRGIALYMNDRSPDSRKDAQS
jgi:hypothetical protein